MLKIGITLALTFFFFLVNSDSNLLAATKSSKSKSLEQKSSAKKNAKSNNKKKRLVKSKKDKSKRFAKRSRRSGNGPDLRALTTESPYTDELDNGVNSVETKQGL